MRRVVLVVLLACRGAAAPSPTAPAPATPVAPEPAPPVAPAIAGSTADSSAKPPLELTIAERLSGAEVVVRGRARVAATRAGHIGSIAVDAILRGAAGTDLGFISGPVRVDEDRPQLYFLRREGARYRVIEQGDRLGLDVALEPTIIAHAEYTSRAVWAEAARVHAADLATFRRGAGKPWTPAEAPAVAAAATVFASIPWIGISSSVVRDHLGPANEVRGDTWRYIRHQGESGQIRLLHFINDRVSRIEIHRTQ